MSKNSKRARGAAVLGAAASVGLIISMLSLPASAGASISPSLDDFTARPPIHALAGRTVGPAGLYPSEVKKAYGLPATGGAGTIAIIAAFDHPNIESDLLVFDREFALASCTAANKCLTVHAMSPTAKEDSGWSLETALDTEWSHAIAPKARILVVEAASDSGTNLMKAIDYARAQPGVVAISMSWGGPEFAGETALDGHFATGSIAYFASSGDDGTGGSWPAVSPNVIAVGGTSLVIGPSGKVVSEKGWTGSGGGVSAYEKEPSYQSGYSIPRANGKRAIPDVAYAADPDQGFSVYHKADTFSLETPSSKDWYVVGGTSAGAPQWAAVAALGFSIKQPLSLAELYKDKASATYSDYFRDITSGANGTCTYYCIARKHYDYVTGLGSPLTDKF